MFSAETTFVINLDTVYTSNLCDQVSSLRRLVDSPPSLRELVDCLPWLTTDSSIV